MGILWRKMLPRHTGRKMQPRQTARPLDLSIQKTEVKPLSNWERAQLSEDAD